MSATVSVTALHARVEARCCVLRESWQSVVLGKYTQDRLALAKGRYKGGRYVRYTALNLKAVLFKVLDDKFATLVLHKTRLCQLVKIFLHLVVCSKVRIKPI